MGRGVNKLRESGGAALYACLAAAEEPSCAPPPLDFPRPQRMVPNRGLAASQRPCASRNSFSVVTLAMRGTGPPNRENTV